MTHLIDVAVRPCPYHTLVLKPLTYELACVSCVALHRLYRLRRLPYIRYSAVCLHNISRFVAINILKNNRI